MRLGSLLISMLDYPLRYKASILSREYHQYDTGQKWSLGQNFEGTQHVAVLVVLILGSRLGNTKNSGSDELP